jgi:hypothetical protein
VPAIAPRQIRAATSRCIWDRVSPRNRVGSGSSFVANPRRRGERIQPMLRIDDAAVASLRRKAKIRSLSVSAARTRSEA